jgi:hypothetical protein
LHIQFGIPSIHLPAAMVADAGVPIRQPGRWKSAILASLAGMILLSIPVTASIAYSVQFPESDAGGSFPKEALPWVGMLLSLALCILAHELQHALLHPDFGRSDSTVLFIGSKKL